MEKTNTARAFLLTKNLYRIINVMIYDLHILATTAGLSRYL